MIYLQQEKERAENEKQENNFKKRQKIILDSYMNDGITLDSIESQTIGYLFKVY